MEHASSSEIKALRFSRNIVRPPAGILFFLHLGAALVHGNALRLLLMIDQDLRNQSVAREGIPVLHHKSGVSSNVAPSKSVSLHLTLTRPPVDYSSDMPSQRSHSSDLDLETAGSQPQRHQPLSLGRLEVVDPPSDSVSFGRQVIAGCFPFHSRDLRNGAHRPENWWRRFHYALAPKNRLLRLFLNGFLLYLLIL